jgi:hypothetical protein
MITTRPRSTVTRRTLAQNRFTRWLIFDVLLALVPSSSPGLPARCAPSPAARRAPGADMALALTRPDAP